MQHANKIVVLGTGGTIAGTSPVAGANVGYVAGQLGVEQLLASVPALAQVTGSLELVAEQVANIDSKDMSHTVWQALVQRCWAHLEDPAVAALVITHGTDTLEETAWLLHSLLPPDKPVVLTCAMRPATALAPDGPQNLLDAVRLATHPQARGVLAVAAGVIHCARAVSKVHPLRLTAFSSGDEGPLGWVDDALVRWAHDTHPVAQPAAFADLAARLAALPAGQAWRWPRVELVTSHAGSDGAVVDALVAHGVDGLVVAATGNGTLHEALQPALERALDAGVQVRIASRCPLGRMLALQGARWRDTQGLSAVKGRISLMLELMQP